MYRLSLEIFSMELLISICWKKSFYTVLTYCNKVEPYLMIPWPNRMGFFLQIRVMTLEKCQKNPTKIKKRKYSVSPANK